MTEQPNPAVTAGSDPAIYATADRTAPTPLLVEGLDISKSFGGVRALDNACFEAAAGEVHALVGENGAGKSTMIKVLGGRIHPDAGAVRLNGQNVRLSGPEQAHTIGAWTVFQELMLFPGLTVAENLLLGREPRRHGVISHRLMGSRADALLASMGITHIDPLALVEDCSLAQRQIVEIVRALSQNPDILFLDEPTSSLVDREVAWLFDHVRALRDRGACVVFTSHRWNEVRTIADRITVFRNGQHVGIFKELDENEAVRLMTGQRLEALFPPRPPVPTTTDPVLAIESLVGQRRLNGVSFSTRPGEILGFGGLAGQGHRELFLTLFGASRPVSGQISLNGRPVRIRSPREARNRANRLALVPEDRKTEGLLLGMTVRDNLTLSILERVAHLGILNPAAERRPAEESVRQLAVRTAGIHTPVGTLSGGNQQKVLLGRWLLTRPRVLLFYDVTRGVDVATKHEIYELIGRLARENRAILFYSSDAQELAELCHRVLVMKDGRIAAELTSPGITAEQIVAASVYDQPRHCEDAGEGRGTKQSMPPDLIRGSPGGRTE
jgi:ribose transport system ATP-binding protein